MNNYLFITNTENFKIEKKIINEVNIFLKKDIKTDFFLRVLQIDSAYEWSLSSKIISSKNVSTFKNNFKDYPIDINFIKLKHPRVKKLLIADMDSTIIEEESLDELANLRGKFLEVYEITKDAMNGKIKFSKALEKRVYMLKDLPYKKIMQVNKKINFSCGGRDLIKVMNYNNATTVLVSGGFIPIIRYVAKTLNFKFYHGNDFIYYKNERNENLLNGYVKKPILNKNSKLKFQQMYMDKYNLKKNDVISVGDGANDIAIIKKSGIGVAYKAKPILKKNADIIFDHTSLIGLLYIQGFTSDDIKKII